MKVKECLVLAAGYGTRMGKVGEYIPKPLWPLFNREILYAQLYLLQEWGLEVVYINSHHKHDVLQKYIKNVALDFPRLKIELLYEPVLLDSGGGVINCLTKTESEHLLIINADVFYLPRNLDFLNIERSSSKGILYAIKVEPESHYNRLIIENEKLTSIVPPSKDAPEVTFSGVSVVHKKQIELFKGISKFFETVLNYKEGNVFVKEILEYEYIDFGTKELYLESLESIQAGKFPYFSSLLKKSDILSRDQVGSFWSYSIKKDRFELSNIDIQEESDHISIDQYLEVLS